MEIGRRLAELRVKRGWTQEQVAEMLGIKRARYNSWENGIAKPDIDFVDKLADLYKVTSDYILGRNVDSVAKATAPYWASSRDIRDLKKLLQEGDIMFDGVPMDETDRQRVIDVLTGLFWDAKKMNKVTYGRKSNKTNTSDDNEENN